VKKELRKWRGDGGKGEEYRKKKQDYKELCERKKKEENERWEKQVEEVKREGDVWEIVNKERKRKREINANIRKEDWREYFMRLTGGREDRVVRGEVRGGREMIEKEEISREEIKRTIGDLKVGKAMRVDGIPNEVWKFGGRSWRSG